MKSGLTDYIFMRSTNQNQIFVECITWIISTKIFFSRKKTWCKNLSFVLWFIKVRRMCQWIVYSQAKNDSKVSSFNESLYYFWGIWKAFRKPSPSLRKIPAHTLYVMRVDRSRERLFTDVIHCTAPFTIVVNGHCKLLSSSIVNNRCTAVYERVWLTWSISFKRINNLK